MSGRTRGGAARPGVEGLEGRRLLAGSGGLTLTAAGKAAGFALATFATGFPTTNNTGPLGVAFGDAGGVLVAGRDGQVRAFAGDTDGQTIADATAGASFAGNSLAGLAVLGGNIYLAVPNLDGGPGEVVQLNADGTLRRVVVAGLDTPTGLIADAATGTLLVSCLSTGTIDAVDPVAGTATPLITGLARPDGLALAPDGTTLYVADEGTTDGGDVVGFDVATKAQTFLAGPIPTLDGLALGAGNLAGNLFVNTNDGRVVEVNLATKAQTVIASGGSRGDFVAVDPSDGALMVTQSDRILRLSAPAGGGFATDPSLTAIAPATLVEGSGDSSLTVIGGGFQNGSVVRWNGVALPTQFVSASRLIATVPAADIAEEGRAAIGVTNPDGTAAGPLAFTVADAPLSATGLAVVGVAGTPGAVPVASFTDANPRATAADFAATVAWGDGTTTVASIVPLGGNVPGFLVVGDHDYTAAGSYQLVVTIRDDGGATIPTTTTATITASASPPNPNPGTGAGGNPSPVSPIDVVSPAPIVVGPADGPRLLSVERFGYHARPTTLVLNFDSPLAPATATDLANYHIQRLGRFVGPRALVPIAAATYTPGSTSVTLYPSRRLNVHWRYLLTLNGTTSAGLAGPTGLALDGRSTGHPGGNATATITFANLVGFDPPRHTHALAAKTVAHPTPPRPAPRRG
ncbi:MAG TPA: hypothetical protein VG406_29220 [Isosphaeraceae bacterium]|jgi:hypothetical protein|nr:hypothetical protein [Isosphaeraceae bacterium]